jgi:hypothetical protein
VFLRRLTEWTCRIWWTCTCDLCVPFWYWKLGSYHLCVRHALFSSSILFHSGHQVTNRPNLLARLASHNSLRGAVTTPARSDCQRQSRALAAGRECCEGHAGIRLHAMIWLKKKRLHAMIPFSLTINSQGNVIQFNHGRSSRPNSVYYIKIM